MEQFGALDAGFAYIEKSSTPMHLGGMGVYDPSTAPGGAVGFKDILKCMERRLDGARTFRRTDEGPAAEESGGQGAKEGLCQMGSFSLFRIA